MYRPTLTFVLIATLFFALTGCKKQQDVATSRPAGDGGPVKIVYIPKNAGNPYFNSIDAGFEEGCKAVSASFFTTAPDSPDLTSQIPFIQDQAQQDVSAICISPNDVAALDQACDDARAKGVKVIMVNSDITGNESHRDAAVFPTDFSKVGSQQIELLGSLINYTGEFAILSSTTNAPDQNFWIEGMKQALKNPKYEKMKLVEIVYGNDQPEKSRTEAEGLISKHPNLRGILAPTTVGVEQAAKTVDTAGVYPGGPAAKNGGIVVTGLGNPNQMRDYLKRGIIPSCSLWNVPDIGYIAACLASGLVKGTIHAEPGKSFDVPGKGSFTFGPNNTVIAGPMVVFTKDNVDQFHF